MPYHPYFTRATPFYHPHPHQYTSPHFPPHSPPSPPPAHRHRFDYGYDYDYSPEPPSLEDEERAAIAHLRAIQRRKEAAAAINAQAKAREAARIELAIEREKERERREAIAQAIERQRERELAQARAKKEREIAFARELEVAQHRAEQHRRQKEAFVQARAEAEARLVEAHRAKLAKWRQAQAAHAQAACARRCAGAGRCARRTDGNEEQARESRKESRSDLEGLNNILGALFGIQLVDEAKSDKQEKREAEANHIKENDQKAEAPEATSTSAPRTAAETATKAAVTINDNAAETKTESARTNEPAFPETINDLLSQFLGLRVEPESGSGVAPKEIKNGVPAGLNDFLAQFGLEFEPDHAEQKGESSTASAAETSQKEKSKNEDVKETNAGHANQRGSSAPEPEKSAHPASTPLTNFLNGVTDLPPFVRDILGNVELAFKEEGRKADLERKDRVKKDKGKAVAEGEKKVQSPVTAAPDVATPTAAVPATPAETETSTASTDSITKLDSIAHELHLATSSFTFPANLSFSSNTPTSDTPALLYNRLNKPYHAQSNKLLQLLLAADSISSNGDKSVRTRRKQLVKEVERAIEDLESKRDEVWLDVKQRRERGEESDDEGWTTGSERSTDHSVVDHEEKHTEEITETARDDEAKDETPADEEAAPSYAEVTSHSNEQAAPTEQQVEQGAIEDKTIATETQGYEVAPPAAEKTETFPEAKEDAPGKGDVHPQATADKSEQKEEQEEGYELL